jgi:hypothetical protein
MRSKLLNKTVTIRARITNDELAQVTALAEIHASGSLSEFIRMACLGFKRTAPKK